MHKHIFGVKKKWQEILNLSVTNRICQKAGAAAVYLCLSLTHTFVRHRASVLSIFEFNTTTALLLKFILKEKTRIFRLLSLVEPHTHANQIIYIFFMTFSGEICNMHSAFNFHFRTFFSRSFISPVCLALARYCLLQF